MAVASGAETITWDTTALGETRDLLKQYLGQPRKGAGNVIAIVGDYGTGKTIWSPSGSIHRRGRRRHGAHGQCGSDNRTFVKLYGEFVKTT